MSKVFGLGVPKFVGTGSPDSGTLILYYSNLDPQWSDKRQKMFESPVSESGHRTWKVKGKHASFTVMVHLHKYDVTPPAAGAEYQTSKAFVKKLLTYEDKDVTFYPFKDAATLNDGAGLPLKDASSNTITCHIADLQFDFLEKAGSRFDVCTITFVTNDFYDINKSVLT